MGQHVTGKESSWFESPAVWCPLVLSGALWCLTSLALADVARVSWSHVVPSSPLHRAGTWMVSAGARHAASAYCKGRVAMNYCTTLPEVLLPQPLLFLHPATTPKPRARSALFRATTLSIARRAAKLTRALSRWMSPGSSTGMVRRPRRGPSHCGQCETRPISLSHPSTH